MVMLWNLPCTQGDLIDRVRMTQIWGRGLKWVFVDEQ